MRELTAFDTRELISRYGVRQPLAAMRRILALDNDEQSSLLRAHYLPKKSGGGAINDWEESRDRGYVDSVVEFASALEVISVICGAMPQLPADVKGTLVETLSNTHVQKYYRTYYPMALPSVFLRRLNETISPRYVSATRSESSASNNETMNLISFIELDTRRAARKDLSFFLDLLDDIFVDNTDLNDVLEAFEDEEEVMAHLQKPTSSKALYRGLRGLSEFMQFVDDYVDLLRRLDDQPKLAAVVWLHNCYWFGVGGGSIQHTARRLQKRLMKWQEQLDDEDTAKLFDEQVSAAVGTLSHLSDWRARSKALVVSAPSEFAAWSDATRAEIARKKREK